MQTDRPSPLIMARYPMTTNHSRGMWSCDQPCETQQYRPLHSSQPKRQADGEWLPWREKAAGRGRERISIPALPQASSHHKGRDPVLSSPASSLRPGPCNYRGAAAGPSHLHTPEPRSRLLRANGNQTTVDASSRRRLCRCVTSAFDVAISVCCQIKCCAHVAAYYLAWQPTAAEQDRCSSPGLQLEPLMMA